MAAQDNQSPLQKQPQPEGVSVSPSKEKPGFFQDENGNNSSLRMMCMTSLVSAIGFGLLSLFLPGGGETGIYFTLAALVGAFAPKAIHKAL